MKKLLFVLMAVLAVTCSSDPVFHGLTQKEKESFAQSIAGEYLGRYEIVYTDAQAHDTPEGDEKLRRHTVSGVTLSVSDLTMHTIIFNDFPVSLLAHVVDDPGLSQALSTLPNMGLTGSYEFLQAAETDRIDWNYSLSPISLSLTYGGQKHNILLQFENTYTFVEFTKGQIAFGQAAVLQLQLTAIYDGDRLLQSFNDVWTNHGSVLIAQFYFPFTTSSTQLEKVE